MDDRLEDSRVAVAMDHNAERRAKRLADVTLLSDGQTIYAAHSEQEVVDVFRRGQGVFGIAIGPVQDEVEGDIHQLFPGEELAGVVEAGAT